ncbi:D-alanyl-D-alanine carboxypeptidase [Labrys wisconsinensis]|uniref:D-alanyl-D-alanine carboxypeptidase n=1 Tax=Labrys wisconsinensis TaxID=425677 RepID=A0ABU0J241_9HYPH|nr:D-alanyl-D-alanine carboxypeptidase [Labrys wisconsinensis]MDQ0468320.1 D-alanyl-D-alanine carboxypeptidase [Labrys wisconsinensis]
MLSGWIRGRLARSATIAVAGIIAFSSILAFDTGSAEARRRHAAYQAPKKHRVAARPTRARQVAAPTSATQDPRFASIVVDVKAGRTLEQANPDGLRHPASITKVMTLYMLFEQLQAGRLTLDSQLPVSAHAAAQAPTKLGLRPGSTIAVGDAIRGIVTRSANDAAVVVAEALGGTEDNFAAMMTRKARSLGMTRTTYRNASGLPNPGQITTARDLATLGVAIQDRFPQYYRFFSTRAFVFRGHEIGNHNRLLGSVEGVDGIKTGYTQASGFNLLTSVKRDGRQLIAVVLGGRSGASRDATMRQLIASNLPRAYAGNRQTQQMFAAADPAPLPRQAAAASVAVPTPAPAKIRPAVVAETPKPKANAPVAAPMQLASLADDDAVAKPAAKPRPRPLEIARPAVASTVEAGPALRWVQGPAPVTAPATPPARTAQQAVAEPATTATVRTVTFRVDDKGDAVADAPPSASPPAAPEPAAAPEQPAAQRSGWVIQIGATDSEDQARRLLTRAQSTGHGALSSAEPFTETVEKNGSTLWRARFAGFEDQRQAQAACAALKSRDFPCMPVRL